MKYINDYAKQNGYDIVKIYPDEAKTATSDRRPAFQEMMKDAAKDAYGRRTNRKNKNTEDIIRIEGGMPAIISKM